MKIYLLMDDTRSSWETVCKVYSNKKDALEYAKNNLVTDDYRWLENEERWESKDGWNSIWIDERTIDV